jgi:hypothetical protein
MPSKPDRCGSSFFREIALAADPVQRLQRTGISDVAQEPHERLAFAEVA